MHPTLLIIVKAWREGNGEFRARLTCCSDLLHAQPKQSYATTPDGAIEIVRSRLAEWRETEEEDDEPPTAQE